MLTNRIFLFALQVRQAHKSQNGYTQRAIKYTIAIKYYLSYIELHTFIIHYLFLYDFNLFFIFFLIPFFYLSNLGLCILSLWAVFSIAIEDPILL